MLETDLIRMQWHEGPDLSTAAYDWDHARQARGAVVVIASDGCDRGHPAQVSQQMQRLAELLSEITRQ